MVGVISPNFGINLFGTISFTARTVGGNNFGGFTLLIVAQVTSNFLNG